MFNFDRQCKPDLWELEGLNFKSADGEAGERERMLEIAVSALSRTHVHS